MLEDLGPIDLSGIHWVIVGGKSGAGARPMHKEWVLSIRDQCRQANVPFFMKQWGGVRKGRAGRAMDGLTYDAMPARADNPMPPREHRLRLAAQVDGWQHRAVPVARSPLFPTASAQLAVNPVVPAE